MDLRKVMLVVIIVLTIILGVCLVSVDYTDLSWSANSSNYIMIISAILLIPSGISTYIKMGKPENSEK